MDKHSSRHFYIIKRKYANWIDFFFCLFYLSSLVTPLNSFLCEMVVFFLLRFFFTFFTCTLQHVVLHQEKELKKIKINNNSG